MLRINNVKTTFLDIESNLCFLRTFFNLLSSESVLHTLSAMDYHLSGTHHVS